MNVFSSLTIAAALIAGIWAASITVDALQAAVQVMADPLNSASEGGDA